MSVFRVIQSKCGKIPTRITPNTDTFHTVIVIQKQPLIGVLVEGYPEYLQQI